MLAELAALIAGGHLLVDDMTPERFADAHHEHKTTVVRTKSSATPTSSACPSPGQPDSSSAPDTEPDARIGTDAAAA